MEGKPNLEAAMERLQEAEQEAGDVEASKGAVTGIPTSKKSGKMSLISQNVGSVSRAKSRKKDNREADGMHGNGLSRGKKRRKGEMEEEKGDADDEAASGQALSSIYLSPDGLLSVGHEISYSSEPNEDEEEVKPVWQDDEEDKTRTVNIAKKNRLRKLRNEEDESHISVEHYEKRLRAQYAKINPFPDWARCTSQNESYNDDSSDEETGVQVAHGFNKSVDDVLHKNEDLVVKTAKLQPGLLGYSRLVDANAHGPSDPPITSTQFHSNGRLLLVAGPKCGLGLYDIDGKRNTKVEAFLIQDFPLRKTTYYPVQKGSYFPVQKASFSPDGSRIIMAGRRNFFCVIDMASGVVSKAGPLVGREEKSLENFEVCPTTGMLAFVGNEGYIMLVSPDTMRLVATLKMNGTVRSLAFAHDGQQLLSHGGDGQVYVWDLRNRACIYKGVDEGCLTGTALCTSPLGNMFAAGSSSGIVNVYKKDEFLGGKKEPMKTIENLTTKVDFMKFNHDAQILAICSYSQRSSLKLVHVPTYTVYSNWPPRNKSLQKPHCLDFSPSSGFMAVGNSAGKVLLYRLHHFDCA